MEEWNSDQNYAFGYYKWLGRSLGFWPLETNRIGARVKILIVTTLQVSKPPISIFFQAARDSLTTAVDVYKSD